MRIAHKNMVASAALLAAATTLAACGKTEPPDAAAVPPVILAAATDTGDEMSLPAMVEQRHFAIYSTYRDALQQGGNTAGAACSSRPVLLED